MIDIENFLDLYRKDTTVKYGNNCIFIALPFFYPKTDESISIKITENDDGLLVLSDCHTAEDYLELRDVELTDYSERLQKIIRQYSLIHDGNVFRMTVPCLDKIYIEIYLGYFIQAITLIANIDL